MLIVDLPKRRSVEKKGRVVGPELLFFSPSMLGGDVVEQVKRKKE